MQNEKVVDYIRQHMGVVTETEVADYFGKSRQSLSTFKRLDGSTLPHKIIAYLFEHPPKKKALEVVTANAVIDYLLEELKLSADAHLANYFGINRPAIGQFRKSKSTAISHQVIAYLFEHPPKR